MGEGGALSAYTAWAPRHLLGRLQVLGVVGEELQCEVGLFEHSGHHVRVGVRLHRVVAVHRGLLWKEKRQDRSAAFNRRYIWSDFLFL